jgi:hypothetical protein
MKKVKNQDLERMSNLVNIRNYLNLQIESVRVNKKLSLDLIKVVSIIDNELNEDLIKIFLRENENIQNGKE